MRATYLSILTIFWPTVAADAAVVIPDCAGRVEIAGTPVMRVERDGTLILDHGRAAVLEGVRLPLGDIDKAPQLLADQALAALRRLVNEGPVVFAATPPQKDRYDRLRAQAFASAWLQRALLERGLARVMIAPDRSDCAPELYEAEAAARKAGVGLWSLPAYRVRHADAVSRNDVGTFQIVEGKVVNIGSGAGRSFIDFDADWRRGFSAAIASEDRKTFNRSGFDIAALRGRHIRLRGIIEDSDGRPQIALSNPAQIELLD